MTTTQVFTLICSSIAVVGALLAMLWLHEAMWYQENWRQVNNPPRWVRIARTLRRGNK